MDNCHRIFIIAKLKSQPYRTLAAVRVPRFHGVSPVSTCYRLLRVFSDEANRTAIQQEITLAADFFGNAHEAEVKDLYERNGMGGVKIGAPCPFPFITTCLIVGASYDPDLGISAAVHEEWLGKDYGVYGQDSDKRAPDIEAADVTVLDITNPKDVRYYFEDSVGPMSERAIAVHTPLKRRKYPRAYSDNSDDVVNSNKAATDGLERYALVELAALAEWAKCTRQTTAAARDLDAGLAHGGKQAVPSLRSLCQATLFQELLSSGGPPDLTQLDIPMLFRGFAHDLQRYLIENVDALCKSPAAVEILKKAFAGEQHFDFAPFHNKLARDDLIALASSEEFKDMKTVNLSGFDSWGDNRTVVRIMEHLKLDSLYLLSSPNRRAEYPSDLLSALATVSNQPLKLTAVHPTYWKNFPVVQLLVRGPTDFNWSSSDDKPWLNDYFLGDALLNPVRFVTGLLNVIKVRFRDPFRAGSPKHALEVSLTFSCAPSSLKALTATTEISPLPSRAFNRSTRVNFRGVEDLDSEGWTAVLVHDATWDPEIRSQLTGKTRFGVALVRSRNHPMSLKYCNITPITPDKLEIVDLREFLELTAPEHVEDLNGCLSELTAWAQTDGELVSKLPIDEVVATLNAFANGWWRSDWVG